MNRRDIRKSLKQALQERFTREFMADKTGGKVFVIDDDDEWYDVDILRRHAELLLTPKRLAQLELLDYEWDAEMYRDASRRERIIMKAEYKEACQKARRQRLDWDCDYYEDIRLVAKIEYVAGFEYPESAPVDCALTNISLLRLDRQDCYVVLECGYGPTMVLARVTPGNNKELIRRFIIALLSGETEYARDYSYAYDPLEALFTIINHLNEEILTIDDLCEVVYKRLFQRRGLDDPETWDYPFYEDWLPPRPAIAIYVQAALHGDIELSSSHTRFTLDRSILEELIQAIIAMAREDEEEWLDDYRIKDLAHLLHPDPKGAIRVLSKHLDDDNPTVRKVMLEIMEELSR